MPIQKIGFSKIFDIRNKFLYAASFCVDSFASILPWCVTLNDQQYLVVLLLSFKDCLSW